MPIVKVKDVGNIKFPDGMSIEQIQKIVKDKYGTKKEDKGFIGSFGEAWAQSDDNYAIGKLVLENDKNYAIDLLEMEYNQWKNSPQSAEPEPWSASDWGNTFGGVGRDMIIGGGVLLGGSFVSTPVGGLISSGAAVTTLQTITAKGGSFRDAYNQIRHTQTKEGFEDKEAAYETARKISNNDAAIAAGESAVSTLLPVKGVGKGLLKPITKPIMGGAVDAAAGGVGSIISDLQAESIGGAQGIDRGDLWENARKAAFQEFIVAAPSNLANSVQGWSDHGRRKKEIADRKLLIENNFKKLQDEQFGSSTMASIRGEENVKTEASANPLVIDQQYLEQKEQTQLQDLESANRAAALKRGESVTLDTETLSENEKKSFHPTYKSVDKAGVTPGKKRVEGSNQAERDAAKRKRSKEPSPDTRLVVPLDIQTVPDMGMGANRSNPDITPILDAKGNVISTVPRVAMPESSVETSDTGMGGRLPQAERARTEAKLSELTREQLNEAMELTDARIKQLADQKTKGRFVPESSIPIIGKETSVNTKGVPLPTVNTFAMDMLNPTRNEKGVDVPAEAARLSDIRGRLEAQRVENDLKNSEKESGNPNEPTPLKTAKQVAEGKAEILAAMKELGDTSKYGLGIDPVPVWKAIKGLQKVAGYYYGRGVQTAKEFAKLAGLKLNSLVKAIWDKVSNGKVLKPKDIKKDILADLGNVENTAEGQAEKTIREMFSEKTNTAYRKLADKFTDLEQLQEKHSKGEPIPDTTDAYGMEQIMHGKVGETMIDFNAERDALLQRLEELGIEVASFENFLYALHAEERNNYIASINPRFKDGGSGMSNETANNILDAVNKSDKAKDYMEVANAVKVINDRTLDIQLEGGLIPKAEHEKLSKFYKRYVPLRGHTDSDPRLKQTGNQINITSDFKQKENAYALGHGDRSKNLLGYSFERHANAIVRAERNKVFQTLLNWANANPDNGVISIGEPKLKQKYNKRIREVQLVQDPNWVVDPDILVLRVNGENQYLRIANVNLAQNLKLMGNGTLKHILKPLAFCQRWFAMSKTTLNPDFIIPNLIRDIGTAGINLNTEETANLMKGLRPKELARIGKGIWKVERGKKADPEIAAVYEQFRKAGGKMAFAQMINLDQQIRDIESYSKKISSLRKTAKKAAQLKLVKSTINVMQSANTAAENTTRLAVFKAAIDSGKFTEQKAAILARNITVNFTKKGEWGSEINTLWLFYSASLNGSLRILQATKSKRVRKMLGGVMALGATENILNQMFPGDEDEDGFTAYDKIPEYVKQTNMIIPVPFTNTKLTIPLPYGYNAVYYAGKQITSVMPGVGGKKSVGDATGDTLMTMVNAFNPIGGSQNIYRAITPEIFKPVIDLERNEDWKGDQIYPERNPFEKYEIPMSQRYWSTVSDVSKNAAAKLNAITGGNEHRKGLVDHSPESFDLIAGFITGGLGKTIARTGELARKVVTGKWDKIRVEDIPVIRRFQENPSPYFEIEKFKKLKSEVNYSVERLKFLRKENRTLSEINEFKKEQSVYLRLSSRIKATDTSVGKLNDAMKKIKRSTSLNSAQKSKKLQELNDRKQLILRRTIRKFVDLADAE